MNDAQLENIELRLAGAIHTPWVYENPWERIHGRPASEDKFVYVTLNDTDERKRLFRSCAREAAPLDDSTLGGGGEVPFKGTELIDMICIARLTDADVANFVAHAPTDIEALIRDVRALRKDLEQREAERSKAVSALADTITERDTARNELVKLKASLSSLREILTGEVTE